MSEWYNKLKRAPWSPPSKVFGIVWPILYTLMTVSFILVWKDKKCYPYCSSLTIFLIQLAFNLCWTTLFFKFKMPKLALIDLIATLIFTIMAYNTFSKINTLSSILLIPYIIWLFIAFSLNFYIVIMN